MLLCLFSKAKFNCDIPKLIEQSNSSNFFIKTQAIFRIVITLVSGTFFICCRTKTARTVLSTQYTYYEQESLYTG